MKRTIRLTESDLHNIVRQCVNEVIQEGQGWDAVKDIWNRRGDWMDDPETYEDPKQFKRDLGNWERTGDYNTRSIRRSGEGSQPMKSYKANDPTTAYDSIDPDETAGLKPVNNSLRGRVGRKAAGAAIYGMYNYGRAKNAFRNGMRNVKKAVWQS